MCQKISYSCNVLRIFQKRVLCQLTLRFGVLRNDRCNFNATIRGLIVYGPVGPVWTNFSILLALCEWWFGFQMVGVLGISLFRSKMRFPHYRNEQITEAEQLQFCNLFISVSKLNKIYQKYGYPKNLKKIYKNTMKTLAKKWEFKNWKKF